MDLDLPLLVLAEGDLSGRFLGSRKSDTTKLPRYPPSPIYPHGVLSGGEVATIHTQVGEAAQDDEHAILDPDVIICNWRTTKPQYNP
jgi:hypothetical protein